MNQVQNDQEGGSHEDPVVLPAPAEDGNRSGEDVHTDFRCEEDLARVLSHGDPNRMKLTAQEHSRALEIKEAVEMMSDLDNLTDFMYAQLAIICHRNNFVEDAIQRCYGMQGFRQEYQILDSHEQAHRHIQKAFNLFPRQILSFSYSQKDGTYVFIHDCTKFEPKEFTTAQMADEWLVHMYYSHVIFCPDFETIRKGMIVLVECEGMTFRRDAMKHFQAFFSQFLTHYPFYGQCRHYHTGTFMNVASSMLRQLLPQELRDTYQVGLQFDGHMGDVFLTPTAKAANKRTIARMLDTLKRRYNNEKVFTL